MIPANQKSQWTTMSTTETAKEEAPPLLPISASNDECPLLGSFHLFLRLPEDLMVLILSFVAEVSVENRHTRSSLTHVLPLVSKQFHAMCQSNRLWQLMLERLVVNEPLLWEDALLKLHMCETTSARELVQSVHQALHEPGYFRLYRMAVARFLRVTGPVLIKPREQVHLGELLHLYLHEDRYRLLIEQVMEGYPRAAREGHVIVAEELPTIIYAHTMPVAPASSACLVEVHRCTIHADGSADLLLIPVAFLRLERVWEQPNTGCLVFAQCLRVAPSSLQEQVTVDQESAGRFRFCRDRCSPSCIIM